MKKLALSCLAFALAWVWGGSTAQATITLTLKTSASTVALGSTLTLTATVSGTTNTGLTWSVNGVTNGNSSTGTLTGSGLTRTYTAPPVNCPNPNPVTFKIVSAANSAVSATATATVTDTIAVTLSPPSASVALSGKQVFTATISNTTNKALNWYVNGVLKGNAAQGTLTACTTVAPWKCTYTAPPVNVPSPNPAVIKVASAADPSKSKTANVTVTDSIAVTLSPTSASVALSGKQLFTATISNTTNTALNWYVNGVLNGNSAQGTLTGTGLTRTYTAPPVNVPSPNPAVIKVASAADPSKYKTANVTVTDNIAVTLSPTNVKVALGGTQVFTATISNTTDTALNWYVNGVPNGNATQGTLTACTTAAPWKCTYTAPPLNVPSPNPVVIEVASVADPSKFQTANVTVTTAGICESGNESVLNGQYAFNLIGYNNLGFTAVVGSITVDGHGNITAGEADTNGGLGLHNASAISAGSYSVGADDRGCARIVTGFGTLNTRFDLGAISFGKATQGKIIEFDPATSSAFIASGQILQQNPADFSAGLNGGYVHLMTGFDSTPISGSIYYPKGGRIACDGVHTDSGNGTSGGTISAGEQYCNVEGVTASTGLTTGITGTYGSIDAHGRLTETTTGSDGTYHLAGYMATTAEKLMVTTDSNPVMAGEAYLQSGGPYSASSLTSEVVIYEEGVDGTTGGSIRFSLGQGDGVSKFKYDPFYENDGGFWTYDGISYTCGYSVASNGGVSGSGLDCLGESYLTAPNTGVGVALNSHGFAGYFFPQTVPSGGFTTASVVGAFFAGTSEIVNQDSRAEGDILTLTGSGSPNVTIIDDKSTTTTQTADEVTTDTITLASNGTFTTASNGSQVVGIEISPTAFLVANHGNSSYPTISLIGPSSEDTVAVSITSPTGAQTVPVNETLGIHVSVTGTSNTSLTWTVYDVTNGNSEYGTITGTYPSFTYTAPATLPSPATFNITATSNADVSKKASLSVTIKAPGGGSSLSITTTSLPEGMVGAAYRAALSASGGKPPYTWSVFSGGLPPCLSLSGTTGTIVGNPATSCEGSFSFTVKVTDSSSPALSQTLPFTITIGPASAAGCGSGNESVLSGQYAFSLSGFNATGYLAEVGSFTADGRGHITAGEVDSNGVLGVRHANITTGASSYSVGPDNRGCATIVTPFYTFTTRFALGAVSSGKATEGRIVEGETGSSAYIATGQILQQTASSFSGGLRGSYAFETSGVDSSNERVGVVGVLSVSNDSITAGEYDANDAGATANGTGATGRYTSADNNGRFTATTAWAGDSSPGHFVLYRVSSSQSLLMTTDAPTTNGVRAGEIEQQSGTFSNSSMTGNVVYYDTGLSAGGSGGLVDIGLISPNGAGSLTGTDYDDEAGTRSTPNPSAFTCTYSVASNGRVTLSGSGCALTGAPFYLTAANTGFMLGSGHSVEIGQFEPQSAGPFSATSFSGAYYAGDLEAVNQAVNTGTGVVTLNGSGGYSTIADYTSTGYQTADGTDTGTATVNSNGTFSTSDHPGVIMGIIISNTKSVMIDNESDTYPTILVVKK
jgi:hypothetical protein